MNAIGECKVILHDKYAFSFPFAVVASHAPLALGSVAECQRRTVLARQCATLAASQSIRVRVVGTKQMHRAFLRYDIVAKVALNKTCFILRHSWLLLLSSSLSAAFD